MPDTSTSDHRDLEWLREGTNKHFERDKRFHGSEYFEKTSKILTQILRPAFQQASIPRDWFAAHVLTEMMIDRVLIKEAPALAQSFYTDLETADTQIITQYLEAKGVSDTDLFLERLARFNQAKYLLQYEHNKAMVFSLNRIFMYTKADGEWTEAQFEILEKVIPDTENVIFESLNTLKTEMQ